MSFSDMRTGPILREGRGSCAVAAIASAGGISALIELLGSLPANFSPPIIIAQHLPRQKSNLDRVLGWHASKKVRWAENGDRPSFGQIYLCPPGCSVQLTERGFSISPLPANASSWLAFPDLLLESMSALFGSRLAAIVLSGALPVALRGLKMVRARGGITMAQSRASSQHFAMPCAAIDLGKVEIFTSPSRMAEMLEIVSERWDLDSACVSAERSLSALDVRSQD